MQEELVPGPPVTVDPDWDLSAFFDSVESAEFIEASRSLSSDLTRWEEADSPLTPERLLALESIQARGSHLMTFLYCESSARTDDAAVKKSLGK